MDEADALATAAFLPALLLTIVFRIWAGYELWRGEHSRHEPAERGDKNAHL